MFQQGIDRYISQEVKKPYYSEVYITPSAIVGANLVASRSFLNDKVKLIILHTMIITLSNVQPNNFSFSDQYNRVMFNITTPGTIFGNIAFPFIWKSDTITVKTPNPGGTGLNFSLVYQYIQELAGD